MGHARETETVLSEAVVLGPRLPPAGPAAAGFLRGEDGGLVTNHTYLCYPPRTTTLIHGLL